MSAQSVMQLQTASKVISPYNKPFSLKFALYFHSSTLSSNSQKNGLSASDKLFADAAREEAEGTNVRPKSAYLQGLEQEHENWTGEERMQDAVLRMLVDKYKPMRTGIVTTAEEKLKQAPPKINSFTRPASGSWATESLLPSSDTHRPWHTEFKVPSHVVSSIKHANIPPPPKIVATPKDEKAKKKEREFVKRTEQAGRLGRARESTLDYRLGLKKGQIPGGRPNPLNMQGWTSLIDDEIERARSVGAFNHIKGRGKPLAQTIEERNPFIAREEFLMNRILKRNEAAPPWVELQAELEKAVTTFRELLRQSYIHRVVRSLTALHPPAILATRSLQDIKAHRDLEWEERERTYHDVAVEELNALVRKYNGAAPYAVRRSHYMRSVEVERLYDECAEEILKGIRERIEGSTTSAGNPRKVGESSSSMQELDEGYVGFRDLLLGWVDRLFAKWSRR